MKPLDAFIDNDRHPPSARKPSSNTEKDNLATELKRLREAGHKPSQQKFVIDISGSKPHSCEDYSPCLTRSRAGSGGFWLSWQGRKMTIQEIIKLQGVNPRQIPIGSSGLSSRQLGLIAGNAVPVDLLAPVMKNLLTAANLQ